MGWMGVILYNAMIPVYTAFLINILEEWKRDTNDPVSSPHNPFWDLGVRCLAISVPNCDSTYLVLLKNVVIIGRSGDSLLTSISSKWRCCHLCVFI